MMSAVEQKEPVQPVCSSVFDKYIRCFTLRCILLKQKTVLSPQLKLSAMKP